MSDEEHGQTESERKSRKRYKPPARTGCVFTLIGLVFVAFAAWLGYRLLIGKPVDIASEEGRKKMLKELEKDTETVAKKAWEVYDYSLQELEQRLKTKPPETKEEITALVNESKEQIEEPEASKTNKTGSADTPPPASSLGKADADYRTGSRAYAKTDPAGSQRDVQVYIRVAKKYFERALSHLDKARTEGVSGGKIDRLEQDCAKRLYDCNKRMEMRPDFDREAETELAHWPE